MKNNIGNMFMNDLQKSLTGEEYDVQSPMRRKEEALKSIAARSPKPIQDIQPKPSNPTTGVPEGTEFFNAELGKKAIDKFQENQVAKANTAELKDKSGAIDDEKDYSGLASAAEDLGKAFAGPTKAIDVGQYSTFAPEDTMAGIRKQVLENLKMRG